MKWVFFVCVQIQNEESSTNLAHKQTPSLLKIDEGVFQLSTLAHVSNQGVIDRLVRPSVRNKISETIILSFTKFDMNML